MGAIEAGGEEGQATSEFRAAVTDIREERRVGRTARWQVQLSRTEFGAGDGGELRAVARSGAVLTVPVLGVEVDGAGGIWHVVEKPMAAGTEVTGRVARRPVA